MPSPHPRLLTTRIRRPVKVSNPHSPLIRQWKLLELLASEPDGVTVQRFAKEAGTSEKTVRRDLIMLRKVGFDLAETVEDHGRKSWRVRQPFERLRSKRRQYESIRGTLDLLLMQVERVEDQRLVKDVRAIRGRVARKCR